MNTLNKSNSWLYLRALKGFMEPESYLAAALLTQEIMHSYGNENKTMSALYSDLLVCADKLNLPNPFPNEDIFSNFYRLALESGEFYWDELLEMTMEEMKLPDLPVALVNLMTEKLGKDCKTVLITEAEKFASSLVEIIKGNPEIKFCLTTQNDLFRKVLLKLCDDYDNASVVNASIYRRNFISEKFDLILANPLFGSRDLVDDNNFICRETDFVALENLTHHLQSNGLLEIILPARISFASGRTVVLRKYVQENFTLRELAELPEGTFSSTCIKTYLLTIENRQPSKEDSIDIKRYVAGERKNRREQISSMSVREQTSVKLSDIENQGNWNMDRIFSKQDSDYVTFQNSATKKDILQNVAEIFRGRAIKDKDPQGNIGVVNISNMGDYDIDYSGLDRISLEDRKAATYALEEGDLLITARGTVIRTCVFHKQSFSCIASSNLIVIRPKKQLLNSVYLKIFLDSPIGRKLVEGTQQGLGFMMISYRDLGTLEIPLPSIEKQNTIAKIYLDELNIYQKAIQEAQDRWEYTLQNIQQF